MTRIDPGVVSLVAEFRAHEQPVDQELEKGKTHHEERRVIDASPAAITLALALSPVELDELERGQRIKGTPARVGMEQMKIADENSPCNGGDLMYTHCWPGAAKAEALAFMPIGRPQIGPKREGRKRMKASIVGRAALVGLSMLLATSLWAQDMVKVAPKNCQVLLDNDRVRVIRVVLKPGEKLPMHSHPANALYSMTAGKTKYTLADGKTEERELKSGQTTWSEPGSHSTENIGTTETRALVIELKK